MQSGYNVQRAPCNIQRRSLYRACCTQSAATAARSNDAMLCLLPHLHRDLGSPLPQLRRDCADLLFQEDQIGAVVTKMAQFHKRFMDMYR